MKLREYIDHKNLLIIDIVSVSDISSEKTYRDKIIYISWSYVKNYDINNQNNIKVNEMSIKFAGLKIQNKIHNDFGINITHFSTNTKLSTYMNNVLGYYLEKCDYIVCFNRKIIDILLLNLCDIGFLHLCKNILGKINSNDIIYIKYMCDFMIRQSFQNNHNIDSTINTTNINTSDNIRENRISDYYDLLIENNDVYCTMICCNVNNKNIVKMISIFLFIVNSDS